MSNQINTLIKSPPSQKLSVAIIFIVSVVAIIGTPYMALATFSYGLLCLGILNKKHRQLHGNLMMTAIILDVSLVLFLELTRNAIETTFTGDLSYFEYGHIASSSTATLCYFPLFIIGNLLIRKKIKSHQKWASIHRKIGLIAFTFRSLGFILMFSLLK